MPGIDRRVLQNFEWTTLALALLLAGIGVVNLVSAAPGDGPGIPPTAWRQLAWLGVGSVALVAALVPDYRTLERAALPVYLGCLALLVAVLLIGPVINGSQRWLVAGGLRLQPSEPAKLGLVLLLARMLQRQGLGEVGIRELAIGGALVAAPVALVLRQPDLGTALLLALIATSFLLVARIRVAALVAGAVTGIAGASLAWFFYLHDYQKERLLTFLNPESDPLGAAYHGIQSLLAVGSGGLFGRGFGKGSQSQLDFLPEQQTDFVFSVLAEEWGFVGAAVVLSLYLGLMVRGLTIARASKDGFGTCVALGVVALFFWAGAANVGMVLGVLPVVGIPLPFLSYGGSSLLVCMLGAGLLMNVSMRRYLF